jgi:biopolymer transport protein ExbD
MKIRRRPRGSADIDLSAFSDIAFLLIIFFILTTTFVKPFGQKLEIPSGTTDQSMKDDDQVTLALKNDRILFGEKGEDISLEQLRVRLEDRRFATRKPDDRMVIVECSDDVPYQRYFEVVMAIVDTGGVLALIDEEEESS